MNAFVNYAQMLLLNVMLIIMTSGYTTTAYVLYLAILFISALLSFVFFHGMIRVQVGQETLPLEFQFITINTPVLNISTYVCANAIHSVLAYCLLDSIFIPVLFLVLTFQQFCTNQEFKKVLECLK